MAMAEEVRYLYYGESRLGCLLAQVITDREERIRVVAAYDLDEGQKRQYLIQRFQGNESDQ